MQDEYHTRRPRGRTRDRDQPLPVPVLAGPGRQRAGGPGLHRRRPQGTRRRQPQLLRVRHRRRRRGAEGERRRRTRRHRRRAHAPDAAAPRHALRRRRRHPVLRRRETGRRWTHQGVRGCRGGGPGRRRDDHPPPLPARHGDGRPPAGGQGGERPAVDRTCGAGRAVREAVTIEIGLPDSEVEAFRAWLADVTAGTAGFETGGEAYGDAWTDGRGRPRAVGPEGPKRE